MTCADHEVAGIAPVTDDELADLAIFPLPQCVLLPGGLLPLHVFEPRYRELTRYCLEGNRPIGIARLRAAGRTAGAPPVYQHLGVGRIMCFEELADGRFLLLLRGMTRAVIEHEHPQTRAFRQVTARRLTDRDADPEALGSLHQQLVALCDRLAMLLDKGGRQLRELACGDAPGACADAVAAALMMDADERQELLEQTDPHARLQAALTQVSRLLCQVAPCDGTVN